MTEDRTFKMLRLTLLVISGISASLAQQNGTDVIPQTGDEETAIDKAIQPVYHMAGIFLNTIIKPTDLTELNTSVDLTTFSTAYSSLQKEYTVWLEHYTAYAVCLAVGVLYILVLPITGCIICGCRSKGRCRNKYSEKPSKKRDWCRRICTALFLLLCLGILFGVVCMFLANDMLHRQTTEAGLPYTLKETVSRLERFVEVAGDDFESYVNDQFIPNIEDLKTKLEKIPEEIQEEVGTATDIGPLMSTLSSYVGELNTTRNNLAAIDTTTADIGAKLNTLLSKLDELKTNVTRDFDTCTTSDCDTVKSFVNSLDIAADYTSVDSFAGIVAAFDSILTGSGNIYESLQMAQSSYNQIQDAVRNGSLDAINTLTSESQSIIDELKSFLNGTAGDIAQFLPLESTREKITDDINPYVEQYGSYVYYAGLAISSAILLVTVVCFLGLLFGACGSQTASAHECCQKSSAVSLLKTGLVILFIFGCIIMIVVAILFPIGGLLHNEVCSHFKVPPTDPQSAKVLDDLLTNSFDMSVSFMGTYASCSQNDGLYSALKLNTRGYDVDTILNPDDYDIESKLDELVQGTYNPGTMDIAGDQLLNNIQTLTTEINKISFASHLTEANKDILSENIEPFAVFLKETAANATEAADLLDNYGSVVESISETELQIVVDSVNKLKNVISSVQTFLDKYDITTTVMGLEAKQGDADSSAISTAADQVTSTLYSDFEELLDDTRKAIKSDVARCGVVADTASEFIDGICKDLLQPYNAFWFSTAWCLVFFVFIIPIAIVLIDFYKRGKPYREPKTPDAHSTTSTTELVHNDRRRGSDRSKYSNRPLPDPHTTEPRSQTRVPYDQPIRNGGRHSPQPIRNAGRHSPQPIRNGGRPSPQHYSNGNDSHWTNLAYDDSHDYPERNGFNWTADSRDPYPTTSDPYPREQYNPPYNYSHPDAYDNHRDPYDQYPNGDYNDRSQNRRLRRTMYPDD